MPITVTIKYAIEDAWKKPQNYGRYESEKEAYDTYAKNRYKIKRTMTLSDDEKHILNDAIELIKPNDYVFDGPKIKEIVSQAEIREKNRTWNVHSTTFNVEKPKSRNDSTTVRGLELSLDFCMRHIWRTGYDLETGTPRGTRFDMIAFSLEIKEKCAEWNLEYWTVSMKHYCATRQQFTEYCVFVNRGNGDENALNSYLREKNLTKLREEKEERLCNELPPKPLPPKPLKTLTKLREEKEKMSFTVPEWKEPYVVPEEVYILMPLENDPN